MEESKGKKKGKKIFVFILILIAVLFIASRIALSVIYNPEKPTTTEKNCEIIHYIYSNSNEPSNINSVFEDRFETYRKETLYNFGLYSGRYENTSYSFTWYSMKWNGEWVIDEDFIRNYVQMYSAEEFLSVYTKYISSFFGFDGNSSESMTHDFYDFYDEPETRDLFTNVTKVTDLLFEMTDLFNVREINPLQDECIDITSEVETITGAFNTGSDNHITHKDAEQTTEIMYYDGYEIEHTYGQAYSSGRYEWSNGTFYDEAAHFYSVNSYYLVADNGFWMKSESLEGCTCKWITVGDEDFFKCEIEGLEQFNSLEDCWEYYDFSCPVSILTTSAYVVYNRRIKY